MSEITIPLHKMIPWRGNVRRTGAADGIEELAASIVAHGLLQSLVVRRASRGRYAVVAGRRRYLALTQFAEAGRTARRRLCRAVPHAGQGTDASEISLAENVVRAPMHPADQFEAFRRLADGGASCSEVAARFGVTETIVAQRMRLCRVSPALLNLYRFGAMSLDQVKALAITDDRAAQERVWRELPEYGRHPGSIRQARPQRGPSGLQGRHRGSPSARCKGLPSQLPPPPRRAALRAAGSPAKPLSACTLRSRRRAEVRARTRDTP